MAYDVGRSNIDSHEYNPWGRETSMLKLDNEHYLVAFENSSGEGCLQVMVVSAAGFISEHATELVYNTVGAKDTSLIHMTGEYYVLAYNLTAGAGYVSLVQVSSTYVITIKSSLQFDSQNCEQQQLVWLDTGHFFLSYSRNFKGELYTKTFWINWGSFIIGALHTESFFTGTSHISDDAINTDAILIEVGNKVDTPDRVIMSWTEYQPLPEDTAKFRVAIIAPSTYQITFSTEYEWADDTEHQQYTKLSKIDDTHFLCVAWNFNTSGHYARTFSINSSNVFASIAATPITSSVGNAVSLLPLLGGYYMILYGVNASYTAIKTFQVTDSYTIIDISSLFSESTVGYTTSNLVILNVTDELYVLILVGGDNKSYMRTIESDGLTLTFNGKIYVNGSWENIESAKIHVNGEWKDAVLLKIYTDSGWKDL